MYHEKNIDGPGVSTMRKWWIHYCDYNELPIRTKRKLDRLAKKKRKNGSAIKYTKKWSRFYIAHLRQLLLDNPEYYLDEFTEELMVRTGQLFHPSSVSVVLRKRLGYSLKVYSEVARQRNEAIRSVYKAVLAVIYKYVDQLVFVDKAAKDENASRRSKAWGRVGEDLTLNRWFKEEVRYTLLAAANVNGFIPESCYLKYRNGSEASKTSEGASGTVDQENFADWVEFFYVLTLVKSVLMNQIPSSF